MKRSNSSFFLFFLLIFLGAGMPGHVLAAKHEIRSFTLKKELFNSQKLHIQALDSEGEVDRSINGRYTFQVNGFEKSLLFVGGNAEYPDDLKSSTFLYMKWEGAEKPVPRLFFVLKNDMGLVPVGISLFWLLVIPLAFIILSFIFKKLIYLVLIVVVLFFLFNKGLSVGNYLVAMKDWVHSHL